ncbi:nucleoside hydrolase [Spirillospora sp. NPDC127200]
MPTPVIIDCDPGHDDAMALLLAVGSDGIDLRAVTVVAGNNVLDKLTLNARRVLSLARAKGVPVAAGAPAPMLTELVTGAEVHGGTGLDGWEFDEPDVPLHDGHAVELMASVLAAADEPVTIIAIGPQTNVAALLLGRPHLHGRIKEIVCMGGSTGRGNMRPYAEYNIMADPEAAAVVLASRLPITYVGLNVTLQALVTPEILARLGAVERLGPVVKALLRFRSGTYGDIWGMPDAPLHDPVAVARVIDPSLVPCREANVEIETQGRFTRGATVVDLDGVTGRTPNARVAVGLDGPPFWELLVKALETLS